MPSIDSLLQRDSTGQIPTKAEQQELERMERLKQSVASYTLKPLTGINTATSVKQEQRIPTNAAVKANPAADHQHDFVCRHCNVAAPAHLLPAKRPHAQPSHSHHTHASRRPAIDDLNTQQPINANEQAFIKQVQHHLEQWQQQQLVIELLPEQQQRLSKTTPYIDRCLSTHPTETHLQLVYSGVKDDGFCLLKRRTLRAHNQTTPNTEVNIDEIDSMFADVDASEKSRKKHKKHKREKHANKPTDDR